MVASRPDLLGAVLLLVLVGGVIPLDAIEDGTQRTLYLLALSTTLVIVALLTRGARVALQRRRAPGGDRLGGGRKRAGAVARPAT
jgi:hypothetical protein